MTTDAVSIMEVGPCVTRLPTPGTVADVQRAYFWFSKPALGGSVCGNHMR
ncbi:hypothetical protein [Nocardia amikacinitolerans]|nr:hypothetical protein [Nocardia amikacinitolerans]